MKKILLLLIALLFAAAFTARAAESGKPNFFVDKQLRAGKKDARVPDEIIVKFKSGVRPERIRSNHSKHGVTPLSVNSRLAFNRVRTPRGRSVDETLSSYKADPDVEYAEPNYLVEASVVPNDPYYGYQWNLDDNASGPNPYGGANGGGINLEPAWDVTRGDPSVIVAVVDTGVAYEDYGNYLKAPDLAAVNFVPGYDFINADTHPNDDNGHGTHVTGTIAQSTDNKIGAAGIAPNTSIMPVKVLDQSGSGTIQSLSDGITFAADHGAKVINLSLGSSSPSVTLQNAIAYAYSKGVTIIAAAGNNNGAVSYPAAYDACAIAVSATRYDETRVPYSNYGSQVDIAAPGGDTTVDQNKDGYGDGILQQTFAGDPKTFGYYFYQGTSMATPHVSGVAALLLAKGVSGPDKVREALQKTAEDKGAPGRDDIYGWGLLDANAALHYTTAAVHDVAVTAVSLPANLVKGAATTVQVIASNPGDFPETVTVHLIDQTDNIQIGVQSVSVASKSQSSLSFSWNTQNSSAGSHILKAGADTVSGETNTLNNSTTTSVTIADARHDVAVIALDTPVSISPGTVASIRITLENQGTYQETTTVTLSDVTGSPIVIASKAAALPAGSAAILNLSWNTLNAAAGAHTLQASASAVTSEIDLSDNVLTNITEIKTPAASKLHAGALLMSLGKSGLNYDALASVKVFDAANAPVSSAAVSGDFFFNGKFLNSVTGLTSADGKVVLKSFQLRAKRGDVFSFTLKNISKTNAAYDSSSNVKTSDSIKV